MKEVGFDLRDAPHSWVPQDDRLRHGDGRAIHRQYKPRKRLRYLTWPFVIAQMFLAEAFLSRGAEAAEIDTSESGDHDGSVESAEIARSEGFIAQSSDVTGAAPITQATVIQSFANASESSQESVTINNDGGQGDGSDGGAGGGSGGAFAETAFLSDETLSNPDSSDGPIDNDGSIDDVDDNSDGPFVGDDDTTDDTVDDVTDTVDDVVDDVTDTVDDVVDDVTDTVDDVVDDVTDTVDDVVDDVTDTVDDVVDDATDTVDDVVDNVTDTVDDVVDDVTDTVDDVVDDVTDTVDDVVDDVTDTVDDVVVAVDDVADALLCEVAPVVELADETVETVVDTVDDTVGDVVAVVDNVVEPVEDVVDALMCEATPVVEFADETIETVVETVDQTAGDVVAVVDDVVEPVGDVADALLCEVAPVVEVAEAAVETVVDAVDETSGDVVAVADDAVQSVEDLGDVLVCETEVVLETVNATLDATVDDAAETVQTFVEVAEGSVDTLACEVEQAAVVVDDVVSSPCDTSPDCLTLDGELEPIVATLEETVTPPEVDAAAFESEFQSAGDSLFGEAELSVELSVSYDEAEPLSVESTLEATVLSSPESIGDDADACASPLMLDDSVELVFNAAESTTDADFVSDTGVYSPIALTFDTTDADPSQEPICDDEGDAPTITSVVDDTNVESTLSFTGLFHH